MTEKTIEKGLLAKLIDSLLEKYEVFAPIEQDNLLNFKKISSGSQLCSDSPRLERSPKEMLLPQCETLFTYRLTGRERKLEEPPGIEGERVLFFTRPCDARALNLIDRVFTSWEPEDTLYRDRRKNTLVIGRACNHPWSTCFCTSLGGSPFGKEGMDLIFEDVGDKYVVEALTERGEKLIESSDLFKDAEKADLERLKEISKQAVDNMRLNLDVTGIEKRLKAMYDDPFWDVASRKCVGCGVCTYLCPVCSCFDIFDEGTDIKGRRIRIWDACQFPLFTLQASGYNPRTSEKERVRQRTMHKFNYYFDSFKDLGCVGCGRCVRECPVNLDIREILREIMGRTMD